tara:strand:+ start:1146 stop:2810 length:1665 start_codon:yes stop_codon:yes gene_type:complete
MAINLIPQRAFSNDDMATDTFTATAGQTVFTLTRSATLNGILVHVNDVIQQPTADYTLNNATLTFNSGLTLSDDVRVRIMTERPLGSAGGASGATTLGALNDVSSASASSGQVLKWSGTQWAPAADLTGGGGGGGIALTDLSVGTEGTPAGNGLIAYNNSTGVFSYTPAVLNGLSATGDVDFGANKILYANVYANTGDLPSASSYHGMFAHVHGTGKAYYAHAGAWVELANNSQINLDGLSDVSTSGVTSGQVLKYNGTSWAPAADASGSSGIALGDISVGSEGTASGDGALAYNNSTGVFTYTPPVIPSVALPDDQEFGVTASGSSAYTFSGGTTGNNPTLTLQKGKTYRFDVNASGHPFMIRVSSGGSSYTNGVVNAGTQSGAVYFTVPDDAPTSLVYQCSAHAAMVGTINIIDKIVPGHILQVKYAQRTDALSYTTTYVEALSADITPTSTSSLILIRSTTSHWHGVTGQHAAKLVKNSSLLNFEAGDYFHNAGTGVAGNINIQYVDAANTTSSINYKIFVKAEYGSGTLNKDYNGSLNGVTSLTVMEIAQ